MGNAPTLATRPIIIPKLEVGVKRGWTWPRPRVPDYSPANGRATMLPQCGASPPRACPAKCPGLYVGCPWVVRGKPLIFLMGAWGVCALRGSHTRGSKSEAQGAQKLRKTL